MADASVSKTDEGNLVRVRLPLSAPPLPSPKLRCLDEPGVGHARRADQLDAVVACRAAIEVVKEALAGAKEDRDDRQVNLVDQPRPQVLLDRGRAATQPHVLAAGGLERSRECGR